eukprot:jgi/Botrbrau1/12068/Bobra.0295s0023.1
MKMFGNISSIRSLCVKAAGKVPKLLKTYLASSKSLGKTLPTYSLQARKDMAVGRTTGHPFKSSSLLQSEHGHCVWVLWSTKEFSPAHGHPLTKIRRTVIEATRG